VKICGGKHTTDKIILYFCIEQTLKTTVMKSSIRNKILPAIVLFAATTLCTPAYCQQNQQTKDTAQKNYTGQKNDSTTTDISRLAVARDTMRLKLNRRITVKKAAQTPPLKMAKGKAEEPWVGGLLKDIVFH
jgi:ABC-type antimicrobial peptide transport system permease subunit